MRQDDIGILLHAAAAFPRPIAKSLHPWQGHAFSTKTGKLGWQPEYHREIEDQPKGEEPSEDEVNSDFLAFFVGNEGGKEAKDHEPAVDPAPSQESASTEPPLAPKPKSPVTITKDGNVWVATWPKDLPKDKWWALKDLVKAAGFKPDTTKGYFRWVTKDPALAAKFQDSEDAEALVAKHNEEQLAKQAKDAEAIASSKATDADIEPPAPQGLKYLPYQKAGIAYGLSHKNVLIADEMGLGKAQPLDAKILTPAGWVTMGEIQAGDLVIGSNGRPTKVMGVYPQGEKEIFRITFSDGATVECCDEHLWEVNTALRRWRSAPPRIMQLSEIRRRLTDAAGNKRHYIRMVDPVDFEEKALPIEPYTLGVLLGDGCITQHWTRITTADEDMIAEVASHLPGELTIRKLVGYEYGIRSARAGSPNPIKRSLVALGLSGCGSDTKFIPAPYLLGSVKQRTRLLQGLLDTDGYVSKDNTVQFSSNSKMLADGVVELVQSLGGNGRLTKKISASGKDHHLVTVALPKSIQPFRISRKASLYTPRTKYQPTRAFAKVESVGIKPAQCIKVDAIDHLYVTDNYALTHNTIQAIGIANTDPEAKKILIVCPASLKLNWKKEWEKWDVKGLKVGVADGKTWPEDADVVILNYDIAGKLAAKVHAQKWDMQIVDESHYLKNQTAQRTKTILGAKGKKGAPDTPGFKAERRVFLTGTPIVNRPKDLWSLVESLDPNGLGQNFFGFMKKYTNATHNGYGWDFSGAANLPDLQAKLRSSFMVRRLKKDVLKELPPKIRSVVTLEPTGDQIKIVKAEQMAAEAMDAKILKLKADVELAKAQSDEQYAEAVKNLKEGAALAFTDMAKARKDVAVAKIPSVIEKAKDLLEETDKIVIMAHHHEVIDALKAEFGEDAVRLDGRMDTKSRDESVVAFQNDPKVKVFIGSIKAAGVGITLTAAHTVLFAELDWVPGNVSQAEDRCHRIGQKDVVDVHHVVLDGTMDSRMANTLVAKQNVIDQALDLGDVKPDDPKLLNAEALKATSIVESDLDLIAPTKDSPATAGITRAQVEEQAKAMEPAQVEAIHQALMVLAGLDSDHAMEKNDVGFNGLDSYIGHSLAKSWELSPKQAVLGAKILAKYHKQIDAETYTLATGKQHPSIGKAKKTKGAA